jgi:signal transduction histidine kinase
LKLTHATRLAMVGELTGMVVHDLSQPLSAILCNARAAELMLQTSNPPALKEIPDILAGIRHDTQRASETGPPDADASPPAATGIEAAGFWRSC